MILIADSGSTKTDWAVVDDHGSSVRKFRSDGINPVLLSDEELRHLLQEQLSQNIKGIAFKHVYFYGAGCRPDQVERVCGIMKEFVACPVSVNSDLLGACRALAGHEEGICCILGTGSASCYYDGKSIVAQTPSLGYVLGDEGSGCSLGKHLLSDVYKRQLPEDICAAFEAEVGVGISEALNRVYNQPWPNRWMASLTPFIANHLDNPVMHEWVVSEFRDYLCRNIVPYDKPLLPVNFVGSVAHYFRCELEEALRREGLLLGTILQSPLTGIIAYHK